MLCVPIWDKRKPHYIAVPLGYPMWQKKESKLELAVSMIRQVTPEFTEKKNVIILCDSWYVKKNLVSIVDDYENLDLIGNARANSVIYNLPPAPTGKREDPTSMSSDCLSTKILNCLRKSWRLLHWMPSCTDKYLRGKEEDSRRLIFSTIFLY